MIPAAVYPLLIPLLRWFTPFAGRGWLAWSVAVSCAACAVVSSRWIFIGLAFLAGLFLATDASMGRKYDQMAARFFALALQGLAICFLATGHFTSLAEKMLFLGQLGIAGIFPFCFSGSEYTSGPWETLPYALCVLLSPFVKFSPILPALSVASHLIGAVNEQYVWKFLHRLFAATICMLIGFAGVFPGYKGLFVLSFYQLLFLYLSFGRHLHGTEYLTMAEIKGVAHRKPGAALELSLGVLILSGGPLSVLFPLLSSAACLLLLLGRGAIAIGICVPLCIGTALAVRWAIQLSLRSEMECPGPTKRMPRWIEGAVHLLWIGLWLTGLQKSYRYFFGF
jgi:hypothetical protein